MIGESLTDNKICAFMSHSAPAKDNRDAQHVDDISKRC